MTAGPGDPTVAADFDHASQSSKVELLRYLHHELTSDDREHISALAAAKAVPMYLVEAGYMVVMFKDQKTGRLHAIITNPSDMAVKSNGAVPSGKPDAEVRLWTAMISALLPQERETSA